MSLFERSEFWALVGVILGFFLNALWQLAREVSIRRRKRRSIEAELRTNLGLLPQKIDHLSNIQRALDHQQILPGDNVHFATQLYDTHIGVVAQRLTSDQREVLHIVYESMKVVDRFLDRLFPDFVQSRSSGQLAKPFEAFSSMCGGMRNRCELVKTMIEEYLAGHPRAVTWEGLGGSE